MKKVLIPRCSYAGGIGQQCLESHPQPLSQERVASAGRLTILPPVGMAKSSSSRLNSDIIQLSIQWYDDGRGAGAPVSLL